MAQNTMESWMIVNGKKGEEFYSNKPSRHLTALSQYYKRKITTEKLVTVTTNGKKLKSKYITKITLLNE